MQGPKPLASKQERNGLSTGHLPYSAAKLVLAKFLDYQVWTATGQLREHIQMKGDKVLLKPHVLTNTDARKFNWLPSPESSTQDSTVLKAASACAWDIWEEIDG